MATVKDLVALIEGEVGNTSGQKYWDYCREHYFSWIGAYVNGSITPYCAAFVTWSLGVLGLECAGYPSLQAFDGSWKADGYRIEAYDLLRGDSINFDWNTDNSGDHVGWVVERLDAGYYITVEGNAGGKVSRCWRDASEILYGIRPKNYESEDEVTDADIDKIAKRCAEYVYGDSDKKSNLNMYNATHWTFGYVKNIAAKLDKIYELLKQLIKQM